MGHYASEMQCDRCGKLRCICPPPPRQKWYAFDAKFNVIPFDRYTIFQQLFRKRWSTPAQALEVREEEIKTAMQVADDQLRKAISDHRETILRLHTALKTKPEIET